MILFGDDLGMQTGPQISPAMYREFFKPRHAALNAYVHERSSLKTFLHSCGSLYDLLPDIVGMKGPLSCLSQARFGIALPEWRKSLADCVRRIEDG